MKLDPNNQIDRLLRRHARRDPDPSATLAQDEQRELEHTGAAHLDADELNAFAENALPPAARTRYSAHLADCGRCRKLVTDLALASGVLNEFEKTERPRTAAVERDWRSWLAALFAPAFLRYAATALVLVGVATTAFLVFRGGQPMRFPTRTESGETSTGVSDGDKSSKPSIPADPSRADDAPSHSGTVENRQSNVNSNDQYAQGYDESQQQLKNEPKPTPQSSGGTISELSKEEKASQPQRDLANEPAPPTVAKSAPAAAAPPRDEKEKPRNNNMIIDGVADAKRTDESAGNRVQTARDSQDRDAQLAQKKDADAAANERLTGRSKTLRRRTPSGPQTEVTGGAAAAESGQKAQDKSEAQETRRVLGRQFVRRGKVWVDTAYNSQATTNVRRGSEQYRALVADESGLRSIAEQLGGEVIVVWKSRAYRIR